MAIDFSRPVAESGVYPATLHFSVVADAAADGVEAALLAVAASHELVSPLARGGRSAGGKYRVFRLSVRFRGRSEHVAFDGAVRAVPGVRVVL